MDELDADIELVGVNIHDPYKVTKFAWERIQDLARLGHALKNKNIYYCQRCHAPNIKPIKYTAEKEHTDIDSRTVSTWTANYCSKTCKHLDPKETHTDNDGRMLPW